jgi:hypothetical protein
MTASQPDVRQTTVGEEAKAQEHVHPAETHTHDHYHVSHHHTGGLLGEFEHRARYHSHEHNHAAVVHGHDTDPEHEAADHARTAHVHDHGDPTGIGQTEETSP